MSLDDEDIARLRKLQTLATPGPWFDDSYQELRSAPLTQAEVENNSVGAIPSVADRDFILSACNLAIPMADKIAKLEADLVEVRGHLVGLKARTHEVEDERDDAIAKLTCVQQLSSEELVTICRLENENKKLAEEYDLLEARYKDLLGRWGQ